MRHEGIKSFYDFRQVTSEELQKEATKLIDVSDCDSIAGPQSSDTTVVFRTARLCMTA